MSEARNTNKGPTLATRRYLDLINHLGREVGGEQGNVRGWKSRVAETLGVDRVYVYQLVKGDRANVSTVAIGRALEKLPRLDRRYFAETDDLAATSMLSRLTHHGEATEAQTATRAEADGARFGDVAGLWPTDLARRLLALGDQATLRDYERLAKVLMRSLPYVTAKEVLDTSRDEKSRRDDGEWLARILVRMDMSGPRIPDEDG